MPSDVFSLHLLWIIVEELVLEVALHFVRLLNLLNHLLDFSLLLLLLPLVSVEPDEGGEDLEGISLVEWLLQLL